MYQFFYSISKLHFISPGDASFSYFIQQQLITTNDDASQHWLTYIKKYIYTKFHKKKVQIKHLTQQKKHKHSDLFWLGRKIKCKMTQKYFCGFMYIFVCVPLTISYYCCFSCACLILINTIGQIWIQKRKKKNRKNYNNVKIIIILMKLSLTHECMRTMGRPSYTQKKKMSHCSNFSRLLFNHV